MVDTVGVLDATVCVELGSLVLDRTFGICDTTH